MLRTTCLALLIFAGVASADVQTGVVRSGGQTIPGATVTAECGTDKITTVTDDAGRFEIGGLPSTPCKYTVLIFGFEPVQKNAAASATPLGFDLTLQGRASVPVAPGAPAVVAPAPVTAPPPAATAPAAPVDLGVMPSLTGGGRGQGGGRGGAQGATGRGGAQAAGGRGGQGGARGGGGFQALSLTQNGDALGSDSPTIAADAGGGAGSGDAFTVNGSVSQGVQAQAGDGFGGGPGGFGFGPGGPGGPGGDFGGPGGGRGGGPGGPAGGGRGGDGGGGGFAGGGGGGFAGGGGGFGGPGGGGRGGGPGGPGGGGRGGPGGPGAGRGPNGITAFGNRAGRGRGPQWQASLNYNFANSALNARPYSFATSSVQPVKAATANNVGGFTLGGPIMIPKTKVNIRNSRWNLNVNLGRNRQGSNPTSSVPLAAFRTGDFSSLLGVTTIYDPLNNTPFANNIIPVSRISPAATALLAYFPNPTGSGLKNNYQLIATNPNNNNNVNASVTIPIDTKDRLNFNVSHQSRSSSQVQNFGFIDPTHGAGGNISASYSRTLQPTLVNTLTLGANRNTTDNLSFFSNGVNVAGQLGINGVLATPATYGPPSLSLTNFSGLNDGTPAESHATTFSISDSLAKTKGKHSMSFGVTGSSRYTNSLTATNARGSFGFSGLNTEQLIGGLANNTASNPTGYDLADLLLGLPASASANQYLNGNNTFYYRQKTAAAFVTDDYRATTALTLSLGLRWEIYGPQTEKYDHMSNVEFSPNGSSLAIVTPGQQDPYNGTLVPTGLLKPDYKMVQPRLGFAWKPWAKRAIVLRGGYGLAFNGGSIAQLGNRLAIQPPFVQTLSLTSTTSPGLTLLNGLVASPLTTVANTYSVAPDYKPAMAQQWNAIAQYTFARSYVAQIQYSGTKGSDLDVLLGPNRRALGGTVLPYPTATSNIQLDESIGHSIYHSGQLTLTRRFAKGIAGSASYTLAKAISDSSTLGGGVVQIENNIAAERAITSDPHHTIRTTFNFQTFAANQKSQFYWNIVRGWILQGGYSLTSGSPFTATVSGDPSGTGITGARANATGLPVTDGVGFFNPLAFTVVPTGTYGTAGRNTIPGIWNYSINAEMQRSFRIGERHRLQMTFQTQNPLNHPSVTGISTVIDSKTLIPGTPTAYSNMRSVSAQARFTF